MGIFRLPLWADTRVKHSIRDSPIHRDRKKRIPNGRFFYCNKCQKALIFFLIPMDTDIAAFDGVWRVCHLFETHKSLLLLL